MPRPQKDRLVACNPSISYFKPRGVPLRQIEEVRLTIDQMEALRLADLEGLSQMEAGRQMGVSRATFGRIVQRARKVVAEALVHGKAILMEGGNYRLKQALRRYCCQGCGFQWDALQQGCHPQTCPECGLERIDKIACKQT